MKSNEEIWYSRNPVDDGNGHYEGARNMVMNETRIDTLEHLLSLMKANEKKLTGDSAIGMVEELIEEIKR